MNTPFTSVYDSFLGRITDDMYMEYTPTDTRKDLQSLLLNAIPNFEFPRVNLNNYIIATGSINSEEVLETDFVIFENDDTVLVDRSSFLTELTQEEINILAILMMQGWLQRQITSIENIRMKYSGPDFKMTSQANHLAKLLTLSTELQRQSIHAQRLYKRRKIGKDGLIQSNWSVLRGGVID